MSKTLLIIQSALAGAQLVVNGTALDGVGLSHHWTVLIALLVAAVQGGVAAYQHGVASSKGTQSPEQTPVVVPPTP